VQPNDTLASLSAIIGISADQLMAANCIIDPDNLEPGSIIYGPAQASAGDTDTQFESSQDDTPSDGNSGDSGETADDDSGDESSGDAGGVDEPEGGDRSEDEDESEDGDEPDDEDESEDEDDEPDEEEDDPDSEASVPD
jgi:hypothetical protein